MKACRSVPMIRANDTNDTTQLFRHPQLFFVFESTEDINQGEQCYLNVST